MIEDIVLIEIAVCLRGINFKWNLGIMNEHPVSDGYFFAGKWCPGIVHSAWTSSPAPLGCFGPSWSVTAMALRQSSLARPFSPRSESAPPSSLPCPLTNPRSFSREQERFVLLCLGLLTTHLSLALAGEVTTVLGGEAKHLRHLLFRMMDMTTPQTIQEVSSISFGAISRGIYMTPLVAGGE